MEQGRELARLNLVLELVTECVSLTDAAAVSRVVAARLRWILDFTRCEIALVSEAGLAVSGMNSGNDSFLSMAGGLSDARGRTLLEKALATRAPASSGRPISAIAYPLGPVEATLGAIYVSAGPESLFSHRELRLLQHICASLGAVLSRIDREIAFDTQRREASALEELSRRERTARDEAIAANAAKDDFLAMLGHELRNPLAPIMLIASVLRREVTGQQLSRVEVILRQARHLNRLVSDLLDVSRITSGRVALKIASTDLRDVATKAAEMARPGMDAKQQELILAFPSEPAMVDGDEVRLAQVLSNLLNNASLYSPAASNITLEVAKIGSELVVSISDTGIGMSAKTLLTAFDMFVQGSRSQEIGPGGLGLGLAVARALVEAHGGRIAAESEGEGLGSRFRLWLPVPAEEEVSAVPTSIILERRKGRALRVLVVDDNEDLADAIADTLRSVGHDVQVVYHPTAALDLVREFIPQVALLDIGLPAMDGYQLADQLRNALPEAPRMIAMSGFGQQRDLEKSRARGFQAHFVKPADPEQLLEAVEGSGCG